MIVSASYRTDIPAFHADWLARRLEAGYCLVGNPYSGKRYRVGLPGQGMVFWTRNAAPLLPVLVEKKDAFPFYFTFTVTGYPRPLERSVLRTMAALDQMRELVRLFGSRACVWRYDPVVISSITDADWHKKNFAYLARLLQGVVDEVILSFMHPYRKTVRNLEESAQAHGFSWLDPDAEAKREMLRALAVIAGDYGMAVKLCCQAELLVPGVVPARCIDVARLGAGLLESVPARGARPGCLCHASRDIGAYDTCTHGCVYCYAVSSRARAGRRIREGRRENPWL